MTVSAEAFKKDPGKYLNRTVKENKVLSVSTDGGKVTILNTIEYEKQLQLLEELETEQGIRRGEEDFRAGRFLTDEQMKAFMDEKVSELRQRADI